MAFIGVPSIQTSTSNNELVPETPSDWVNVDLTFKKFSFINYNDCSIKINDGSPIFLKSEQGFESNRKDGEIKSFIIVEENVKYSFIGVS